MRITINIPRRVVYMAGASHSLSLAGCNRVFVWLLDNARLLWGWDSGEYVFHVEVSNAAAGD